MRIMIMLGVLLLNGFVLGQDATETVWEKSIQGGLNMTQTGFDNWVAGGESAFAWQLKLNAKFVQDLEKTNWSTTGKIAYGATKTGALDSRKSIDELKIESVLTYKLGSQINPFAAITGETQLAPGYDYDAPVSTQISAFMDPGYFRESFGVGFDANANMKTRLGMALKQTTTTDFPTPYADDVSTVEIETFKNEAGLESVTDVSWPISKTAKYDSKIEIFSAFQSLDATDINWDNQLTVKISKYLNMNMNIQVIYDKDLSEKRQIKQAMALGLNYTFI